MIFHHGGQGIHGKAWGRWSKCFPFSILAWEGEAPAEPKDDWVVVPELVLGGPRWAPLGGRGSCRAEDDWNTATELVLGGPGGEVGLVCVVFHHGGHGGTQRNAVGVVVF